MAAIPGYQEDPAIRAHIKGLTGDVFACDVESISADDVALWEDIKLSGKYYAIVSTNRVNSYK